MRVRTGDTVKHHPSGETWVVAFVEGEYLAWCGWPPGLAKVDDCELVEACSDEESLSLLKRLAGMEAPDDHRMLYAKRKLAEMGMPGDDTHERG